MKKINIALLLFLLSFAALAQGPNFTVSPNPVCVGQPVTITNTSQGGYSTFDWSFCAANPEAPPDADILNVSTDNFNKPVFVAIVQDPSTSNFHAFVSNYDPLPIAPFNRHITRLDFGNDILNQSPNAIPLNTGASYQSLEGIQIVREGDTWYGFVVGGQAPPYISQLNFGTNILNANPTRTYMVNVGQLSYPHDLYVFKDEATNQWFGLTVNAGPTMDQGVKDGSVTRFHFNQGLNAVPVGVNLGGWGILEDPVGIYAIKEGGNWYVFVTDRWMGLVRLNFGSSLTNNNPTPHLIGNFGGVINRPRDISLLRYCDDIYGFVVNETMVGGSDFLVRLHFENGINQTPTASSIPELNSQFAFPHSISEVLRSGDEMFALITNVINDDIVRIFFPTCDDDIPSQTGPNPTPVVYNIPGTQTIELIVDLGLPTQENVCHDIVIHALPTASLSGGTGICEGDAAEIYVTFTGAAPWSFTYTDGATPQNIQTSQNPYTLTVSPSNTTIYTITALSDANCTGNNLGQPITVQVTPIDDATFSYPTQTLCTSSSPVAPVLADPGTNGTFTASPPGLSINPTTGVINPAASTINIPYTVTYTTVGNCPDSHQVTPIIVTDQPEANFTYNSSSFCRNEPVQNPQPGSPTASFGEFSAVPDGLHINPVNGAINPALSEPGNYVVTNFIPAADGCPAATYTQNVEIAPLPTPDFVADTVCLGTATTLTSTSTLPSGSISEYIWYYQGNPIGYNAVTLYDFPNPGIHQINLRVVSNKGCADEITKSILVLEAPAMNPQRLITQDTIICVNHTSPIRLDLQGGSGKQVEWFTGGCGNGSPFAVTSNPFYFLSTPPAENTTYYARWTSNCNVSQCDSITVKVYPLPEVSFTWDTVCYGKPTPFSSSTHVEDGEIVEWEWRFETGLPPVYTDSDTASHIFTQSGNHQVTLAVRSDKRCWGVITQNVYVLPAPPVDLFQRVDPSLLNLSANGDTLYWCVYNSLTLDASDPGNPYQSFEWSVGAETDTLRIGALGIGYELQYHKVYVTNTQTGCISEAEIFVEFSIGACETGINMPGTAGIIRIYPNPANDQLTIEVEKAENIDMIQLVNLYGQAMRTYDVDHISGEYKTIIPLSAYSPGVYFVRIIGKYHSNTYKVIVNPGAGRGN